MADFQGPNMSQSWLDEMGAKLDDLIQSEMGRVPSYCERYTTANPRERRQCASCHEWYTIGVRTRRLLLTYCTVACAVRGGMDEQIAEQQLAERVEP